MVYWLVILCLSHSKILLPEGLPSGALPKGGRWESSGSDEESEIEQEYVSREEHRVYKRLMIVRPVNGSLRKRTSAYVKRGRLLNRNGYALSINPDGTVDGTTNKNSRFGKVFILLRLALANTSSEYSAVEHAYESLATGCL